MPKKLGIGTDLYGKSVLYLLCNELNLWLYEVKKSKIRIQYAIDIKLAIRMCGYGFQFSMSISWCQKWLMAISNSTTEGIIRGMYLLLKEFMTQVKGELFIHANLGYCLLLLATISIYGRENIKNWVLSDTRSSKQVFVRIFSLG